MIRRGVRRHPRLLTASCAARRRCWCWRAAPASRPAAVSRRSPIDSAGGDDRAAVAARGARRRARASSRSSTASSSRRAVRRTNYAIAREFLERRLSQRRGTPTRACWCSSSADRPPRSSSTDDLQLLGRPSRPSIDGDGRYTIADVSRSAAARVPLREGREGPVAHQRGARRHRADAEPLRRDLHPYDAVLLRPDLQLPGARPCAGSPTRPRSPTRIVNALLAGPSDWLQGGGRARRSPTARSSPVRRVIDSGRRDGRPQRRGARRESAMGKRRMTQQLTQSLGTPQLASRRRSRWAASRWPSTDGPEPDQLDAGALAIRSAYAEGRASASLASGVGPTARRDRHRDRQARAGGEPRSARNGDQIAAARRRRASRSCAAAPRRCCSTRERASSRPRWTRTDFVWTRAGSRPRAIIAFDGADGKPHPVAVCLPTVQVVSLERLARRRAAAHGRCQTACGPAADGRGNHPRRRSACPTALGRPTVRLADRQRAALDATWVDERHGCRPRRSTATQPTSTPYDARRAQAVARSRRRRRVQIVGGNGGDGMRVLDADGDRCSRPRRQLRRGRTPASTASFLATQQ